MKIAFSALCQDNKSGTGRYATELLKALANIDVKNEYSVLLPHRGPLWDCLSARPNFRLFTPNPKSIYPITDFTLTRWLAAQKAHVFHAPAFILPLYCATPSIVTIHDLAFHLFPQTISLSRRLYYRFAIPRSIRVARLILADSVSTANDLTRHFDVPSTRIRTIPLGVDEKFFLPVSQDIARAILAKYNLPANYILTVGTQEPRKNLPMLLRAYKRLLELRPDSPDLVIAGRIGWKTASISSILAQSNLAERIHFPGFIDDNDLPAIYQQAKLFACISLYEGFGLPVLEAMASGVPIICSDNSSFPEVAGGNASFVNPTNLDAIIQALMINLKHWDESALLRAQARASDFSWHRTACSTLDAYLFVYEGKGHNEHSPCPQSTSPHSP